MATGEPPPLEVTFDIEDGEQHQSLIRLERRPALPGESPIPRDSSRGGEGGTTWPPRSRPMGADGFVRDRAGINGVAASAPVCRQREPSGV